MSAETNNAKTSGNPSPYTLRAGYTLPPRISTYEHNIAVVDGFQEMRAEQNAVFEWINTLSPKDEQTLMRLLRERKKKHDLETGATLSRPVALEDLSLDQMKAMLENATKPPVD